MNSEGYKPSLNPVSVVLEPQRAVADPGEPTSPPPLLSQGLDPGHCRDTTVLVRKLTQSQQLHVWQLTCHFCQ